MSKLLFYFLAAFQGVYSTDRPIIGIVTQWYHDDMFPNLPEAENHTSYLAASYVKWIEAAGAQVVPVIVDTGSEDLTEYFKEVFAGVNGVLFPGGGTSIYHSGYSDASNAFFQMAKEANDAGDVFPIWGTCLGFEMITLSANNGEPYLKRCNSYDQPLPLELEGPWRESKMFGTASEDIIDQITTLNVTANFHHWCLTRENFTKFEMEKFWNLLSVNTDEDGLEFVSTLEAKEYPFFATQFHPEKNSFEWSLKRKNLPHGREATATSLHLAQIFVDEARRSEHSFPSREDEERHMIYNHRPYFVGQEDIGSTFTQVYLF